MPSTTVRNWQDLKAFGIIHLTGEACHLAFRMLCDLTPAGVEAITQFLGAYELRLARNHNWHDGQVASILLPTGLFWQLAVWLLLYRAGHVAVVEILNPQGEIVSATGVEADRLEQYQRITRLMGNSSRVVYRWEASVATHSCAANR